MYDAETMHTVRLKVKRPIVYAKMVGRMIQRISPKDALILMNAIKCTALLANVDKMRFVPIYRASLCANVHPALPETLFVNALTLMSALSQMLAVTMPYVRIKKDPFNAHVLMAQFQIRIRMYGVLQL